VEDFERVRECQIWFRTHQQVAFRKHGGVGYQDRAGLGRPGLLDILRVVEEAQMLPSRRVQRPHAAHLVAPVTYDLGTELAGQVLKRDGAGPRH